MKIAKTLEWFVSTGERKAQDINRAKILLKADDGLTDEQICEHVGCSIATPYNVRKRYTERGLDAIHRKKADRDYQIKLDGNAEAHLLKLACSEPPEGHSQYLTKFGTDRVVRDCFRAVRHISASQPPKLGICDGPAVKSHARPYESATAADSDGRG